MKTQQQQQEGGGGRGVAGVGVGEGGAQQPFERDACGILTAPRPQSWKPVRKEKKKRGSSCHLLHGQTFADPPVFLRCCESGLSISFSSSFFAVENCSICSSPVEASEMVQPLRINDGLLRNF